ncbi:hypothetical protein GCM10007874_65240 [Labrys miyagiensis]|uniref:HEAT repeat domain-containing protein n=2 Tax=Labrys miyagiensis TaxID=346912 RepID=A0ABQ6CT66_9HYPH|nr:hypothetical protein GCM10007874_65240 [Labrys miyagiensis]
MAASKKPSKPKTPPKSGASKAKQPELDAALFDALQEMLSEGRLGDLFDEPDTPQELIEEIAALEADESRGLFEDLVDALSDMRIEANSGNRQARQEVRELLSWLEQRIEQPDLGGSKLVMVAQAFGAANLALGPSLQAAITRQLQEGSDGEDVGGRSLETLLEDLADEMDGDPLEHFDALSHIAHYLSEEAKWEIAAKLASNQDPRLREMTLGFLLTADDRTAGVICDALVASTEQNPPESRLVSRLALVRALVLPDRAQRIDSVLAALRPHVVPSPPERAVKLTTVLASVPDGAGATTIAASAKGRPSQTITLLIKTGLGIVEISDLEGITGQRLKMLFAQSDIRAHPASQSHVATRLAAAVAENWEGGTPVPPLLVRFMELLELSTLPANDFEPEVLFDEILSGVLLDVSSLENQRTALQKLQDEGTLVETWFEANDEIDALLSKIRSRDKRLEALLTSYLPTRRWFWIRQCAWTAGILREQKGRDGKLAVWVAVLGKQLCSTRPLAESPLMQAVAEGTIKAFMLQ